ncbi:MAG: PEP-CTERM sorting domain-containing protein [Planctomycetaceae bacterium]|nr:PEP-CTERM sorting domain-containing protein [Planctomycetaceae bacterium]
MVVRKENTALDSKRWSKYLLATAAGTYAVLGAQANLDADITTVLVDTFMEDQNQSDGLFTPFGPYTFGASGASFSFQQAFNELGPGLGILVMQGGGDFQIAGNAVSAYFYPSNLAYGANISSLSFNIGAGDRGDMAFGNGYPNSQFLSAGQSYVAFRFDLGGGTQYGYAELIMNGAPDNRATFVQYSYGDVGDRVTTGELANAVPEPSALGALALGAIGVAAWRRRRRVH